MSLSAIRVAILMVVVQQMFTAIFLGMTIDYLPLISRNAVLHFVATLLDVLDPAHPLASLQTQKVLIAGIHHLSTDVHVLMWFGACHVVSIGTAWKLLRVWISPPCLATQIFGGSAFVVSSLPLVVLHETWHQLITGLVLSRKLPCQRDSIRGEPPASTWARNVAGGKPANASWGRSSL